MKRVIVTDRGGVLGPLAGEPGLDILVAELEAALIAAADDLTPDYFGADARLDGIGLKALLAELLRELPRRGAHAARHVDVGVVDVLLDAFDLEALEQLNLELLVDQLFDHV